MWLLELCRYTCVSLIMGLEVQCNPCCGEWGNVLLLNATLRLWWQLKETGTLYLLQNTTTCVLCQRCHPRHLGNLLQTSVCHWHFFLCLCRLPATSRKLASHVAAGALIAGVWYFWLFLELTFSPKSLPALASDMVLEPGMGQGSAGLPALPLTGRMEAWPSAGKTAWRALIPWPGFAVACTAGVRKAFLLCRQLWGEDDIFRELNL